MAGADGSRRGHDLEGHRRTRLGPSPFADVAAPLVAAAAYAVAAVVAVAAGDLVVGGRWLAVHLFTLGVLTNAVVAFTEHFGRSLTHGSDRRGRWQTPGLNVAVVATLIGFPTSSPWLVGIGGTAVTAVVGGAWLRLRRLHRHAPEARFAWVVRTYERAHEAFLLGALFGILLGTGALVGPWYVSGRLAHLHLNVLGWGGLTLLATVVFFGPTVVRTQMVRRSDRVAGRSVLVGTVALGVAVVGVGLTALDGAAGTAARLVAAAALAVFAAAASVIVTPVAVAAVRAKPSAPRWHLVAVVGWIVVVAWGDVAVVASGRWELLDALGLTALLGVLLQAIVMVAMYVTPLLRGRSFGARDLLLARLEIASTWRAVAANLGVALLAGAAALGASAGDSPALVLATGWALVAAAVAQVIVVAVWPLPEGDTGVRSRVAQRYRE